MIMRLLGRKVPNRVLLQEIIAICIGLFIVAPLAWWATDRTPPQVRLVGTLLPPIVVRGEAVRVRYTTTKRVRADCPGVVQQEIVDSQNTIFSKFARAVGPAIFEPDPNNPNQDILIGHPVIIPEQVAPGQATFRTVTFRYCNWLQRILHWPIVQIGPDIHFEVIEK